jgi:hypothetical protein
MANENKEIRLGLGLDEASFRRLPTLLTPIVSSFQAVTRAANEAFGAMGGRSGGGSQTFFPGSMGSGGGAFGRQQTSTGGLGLSPQASQSLGGSLVQNLRNQQTALTTIASGSKEAMKAMTDATKRALADQRTQLMATGLEIEKLAGKYNEAATAAAKLRKAATATGDVETEVRAEMASRHATRVATELSGRMGDAAYQRATIADLQRNENLMTGGGFRQKALDVATVAAGVAQGLSRAAGAGAGLAATVRSAADVNSAATLMTGNRILGELGRGDYRGLMQLSTPNARRILERYGTDGAAILATGSKALGEASSAMQGGMQGGMAGARGGVAGVATGATLGALPGVLNLMGTTYNTAKGGLDAVKATQVEAALQMERQFSAAREFSFDQMMAHAGTRVHGAKALQGNQFRALGIGMGHGLSFEQSVGQAESILRATGDVGATFNMPAIMGTRTVQPRLGVASVQGSYADMENAPHAFLDAKGRTVEKVVLPKTEKYVKEKARLGYMALTNRLMKMGFSESAAAGSLTGLGQAAVMGGTESREAPEVANRQIIDIFARGTEKGFTSDKTLALFSEAIAKGMSEAAVGAGGALGGYSDRLQTMFAGLGTNALGRETTMRDVQSALAGRQALDNLAQNNSYFQMQATSAALKALGGDVGGLELQTAAGSTLSDLLGGSEALDIAGVTAEQRREMLQERAGGIMGAVTSPGVAGKIEDRAKRIFEENLRKNPNSKYTMDQARAQAEIDVRGLAFAQHQGVGLDVGKQAAAQLSFMQAGVFTRAKEFSKDQIQAMSHSDFAASVFGVEGMALLKALKGEKEISKFFSETIKEGNLDKTMDALLQNRTMATGEFAAGNQYVVQVIRGPLKKGGPP